MDLVEFLTKLDNPIKDESIIRKLIEIYSRNGNFYNQLINFGVDPRIPFDKNNKFVKMFQSLTRNCIIKEQGLGDFMHVLTKDMFNLGDIHHRLYVSASQNDVFELMSYFMEKCYIKKMPFYFKYATVARKDSMILYSDTNKLMEYVQIFDEISNEHPELIGRLENPPMLTGRARPWLGYGEEPPRGLDGKKKSYTEVRASIVEESIDECMKNLIRTRLLDDSNFISNIAEITATKWSESLKKGFDYYRRNYSDEYIEQKLGYRYSEVKNGFNKNFIKNSFTPLCKEAILLYCKNSLKYDSIPNHKSKNGVEIMFPYDELALALKQMSSEVLIKCPNATSIIRYKIQVECNQHGIDPTRFCIGVGSIENYRSISENKAIKVSSNVDGESREVNNIEVKSTSKKDKDWKEQLEKWKEQLEKWKEQSEQYRAKKEIEKALKNKAITMREYDEAIRMTQSLNMKELYEKQQLGIALSEEEQSFFETIQKVEKNKKTRGQSREYER